VALATVVLTAVSLAAQARKQPAKPAPPEAPRLAPELETIYGMALAAPPEFAASALLRLTARVADKSLRRSLIDMSFHVAAKARTPVRLVSVPGIDADSRTAFQGSAMQLRLDALSLQAAAIRAMLADDPRRARDLFPELSHPRVAPSTCQDGLVADVSDYYLTAAAVARAGFTARERTEGEPIAFVRTVLSDASAIADMAPAAGMVAGLDWPREQFELAAGALAGKLEAAAPDCRSFLFHARPIDQAVAGVIARLQSSGGQAEALAEAYRKFLVTQLRAPRCADAEQGNLRFAGPEAGTLFGDAMRGEQPALTAEEMTPESVEGEMKREPYWQTSGARKVYEECLALRQSPSGVNYSEATRRTPEWNRRLTDFLSTLANWSPAEEASDADYYHQKATVYEALLELAPPGDAGPQLIQSYLDFLKSSNVQRDNPAEWFWHARSTVNRVRPVHPEQADRLLAAFRASGNIVLVLEAMLEALGSPDGSSSEPR
jgi:hypothetical protein